MCTEFLLAIVYFTTLFVVNFFLLKLLFNYWKAIFSSFQLKRIFSVSDKVSLSKIANIYLCQKKRLNKQKFFSKEKKIVHSQDILLLGNFYKILVNKKKVSENYYLQLLELQYLARGFFSS